MMECTKVQSVGGNYLCLAGLLCCLAYAGIALSAPKPDVQPLPGKVLIGKQPVNTGSAYQISAPACVKSGSVFSVTGKGLVTKAARCAVSCGKGADLAVHTTSTGPDKLTCVVKANPTGKQCMLGAKSANNWLVSRNVNTCTQPEKGQAMTLNTPPAMQHSVPPPVKPAPLPKPVLAPPAAKPATPAAATPGFAAGSRASEIRHTVPFALTMTGLGNTGTRIWEPVVLNAGQSLTMRGMGDAPTTRYEPINITSSTSLTVRGVYSGEY